MLVLSKSNMLVLNNTLDLFGNCDNDVYDELLESRWTVKNKVG